MSQKVSLDPFTRVEGHLAIHLDVENFQITGAYCSGEMYRGIEYILKGRSPLDAQQITQRICGVCPTSQGIASILAQEEAYGIEPTQNGLLIRNIMLAGNYIQNHLTHFYHLSALDFIDVQGIQEYTGSDYFLNDLKDWIRSEINSKSVFPAAPFMPRYEGRYMQEFEGNITVLRNYFQALEMRALAHQLVAVFAGKMPHMATIVPSGVTEKVTTKKIAHCRSKLFKLRSFIEKAYLEDALLVANAFPEYFSMGKGCGNYMTYGVFLNLEQNNAPLFPRGVMLNNSLETLDTEHIAEEVKYSKYTPDSGRHKTDPSPHKEGAYSWIKAPRYKGKPMEVGPLARIMLAYDNPQCSEIRRATDSMLQRTGRSLDELDSCLGRHLARIIELQIIVRHCEQWIDQLDPRGETAKDFHIPNRGQGAGLTEAPRGALGHWLQIEGGKIDGYECIVPTTWNCSPKDNRDVPGPVERALQGTTIADENNPLEASRIVRAFDPCLACAVH